MASKLRSQLTPASKRYCPICKAYTKWSRRGYGILSDRRYKYCENDKEHSNTQSRVYVRWQSSGWQYVFERLPGVCCLNCPFCSYGHKKYEYVPYRVPCCSRNVLQCYHYGAVAEDEAVVCRHCGDRSLHGDLHWILIEAMVAEADSGTFKPDMWKANFPRRTAALIKYQKEVLAEALVALPPVLVGIVGAYL